MKRQKVQFLILIVVLVMLIGGYFGLQKYNEYLANQPEATSADMVIDMDSNDVLEIAYTYEGETYSFIRDEGVWKNKEDPSLSIMQSRIENMASKITQVEAKDVIENVTDMSQYGLDNPSRIIQFSTTDRNCEVRIGDYNSMSSVYYLSIDDDATVYAVETALVTVFSYTLDELIEEEEAEEETIEEEFAEEAATVAD